MSKNNFTKYYRVFSNDTAVTEISANDFKPVSNRFKRGLPISLIGSPSDRAFYFCYSLPAAKDMFYGYISKVKAMEMAKAGAMDYINRLIEDVEQGIKKLKDYRASHYHDLNTTLLESNIRKVEREMHIK